MPILFSPPFCVPSLFLILASSSVPCPPSHSRIQLRLLASISQHLAPGVYDAFLSLPHSLSCNVPPH